MVTKKPPRSAFIAPLVREEFFKPIRKGIHDVDQMMGVDCSFTGAEDVDVAAQAQMVQRAVADGYDCLAVSLVHPHAFNPALDEAPAQGVPVVAFNVDGPNQATRRMRIAPMPFRVGYQGTQWWGPRLPSGPATKADDPVSHMAASGHQEFRRDRQSQVVAMHSGENKLARLKAAWALLEDRYSHMATATEPYGDNNSIPLVTSRAQVEVHASDSVWQLTLKPAINANFSVEVPQTSELELEIGKKTLAAVAQGKDPKAALRAAAAACANILKICNPVWEG